MNSLKFILNLRSFQLIARPQCCRRYQPFLQIRRQLNERQTKLEQKSDENQLNLDLKDSQSGDRLVYSGPENVVKMIKMIKKFSISTTLIAGGVQPFIFQQILATNSSTFAVGFACMTSGGIVLSPLILNWFTKRYVTELYYNYETQVFTAWILNLLCRRVCVQYRASDVSIPDSVGVFTTYIVGPKGKPFFVDPEFVTDFNAYKLMLGYDKPLDIKLNKILNTDQQNDNKIK